MPRFSTYWAIAFHCENQDSASPTFILLAALNISPKSPPPLLISPITRINWCDQARLSGKNMKIFSTAEADGDETELKLDLILVFVMKKQSKLILSSQFLLVLQKAYFTFNTTSKIRSYNCWEMQGLNLEGSMTLVRNHS